jgi:DMSO reductase family type II enzyme heme b subunit
MGTADRRSPTAVVRGEAAFAARGGLLRSATFVVALASLAVPGFARAQETPADHPGKSVYDKWCASCHGVEGDGRGPAAAWMLPRPRDFTEARYQVRTTPSGALPTDEDIMRIINRGMPGTSMPGWESQLSRRQRQDLVDYLKSFSRFFEFEDAPPPIDVGRAPRMSDARIENGRRVYQQVECWKCHGDSGRGDGASAPTQTDDNGFPIRPADLTEGWMFNGGGSTAAIYTRLRTGLDGTPMPSFADLVDAGIITDDDLWDLALYVRSLSPESRPEARDVIRATLVEGALPASTDDEAWTDVDRYYVPLVGQILVEPRWFAPTVDGVWVQAAHDQDELVMRLEWNDPSESPDPAWEDWRALVAEHVEPAAEAGGAQRDDGFTIQLPVSMPDGRQLPFFLGGDARNPVYLLRWRSGTGMVEAVGRGIDQVEPLADAGAVSAEATFQEGRWRLLIRRPLTVDADRRPDLPTGTAIPVAFFAQDGSSGETGHRGAISSWYFLHLDTPVPTTVYTAPIAATILTAVFGLAVVARARRADRRVADPQSDTPLEGAHP